MNPRPSDVERYSGPAIALHWLIALLIIAASVTLSYQTTASKTAAVYGGAPRLWISAVYVRVVTSVWTALEFRMATAVSTRAALVVRANHRTIVQWIAKGRGVAMPRWTLAMSVVVMTLLVRRRT